MRELKKIAPATFAGLGWRVGTTMNRVSGRAGKNKGESLRLPNGKTVGRVFGSVAAFTVRRSKHYFRAFGGYSLDAQVLTELERVGVSRIEFRDKELGQTFRVSFETFMARARPLPSYGFGAKVACHERHYQDDSTADLLPLPGIAPTGGYHAPAQGA